MRLSTTAVTRSASACSCLWLLVTIVLAIALTGEDHVHPAPTPAPAWYELDCDDGSPPSRVSLSKLEQGAAQLLLYEGGALEAFSATKPADGKYHFRSTQEAGDGEEFVTTIITVPTSFPSGSIEIAKTEEELNETLFDGFRRSSVQTSRCQTRPLSA